MVCKIDLMTSPTTPIAARTTPLEYIRRSAGWSRPELGRRSGVSVATILALERSGRRPHLDTARRLSGALGMSVDRLFPTGETND